MPLKPTTMTTIIWQDEYNFCDQTDLNPVSPLNNLVIVERSLSLSVPHFFIYQMGMKTKINFSNID